MAADAASLAIPIALTAKSRRSVRESVFQPAQRRNERSSCKSFTFVVPNRIRSLCARLQHGFGRSAALRGSPPRPTALALLRLVGTRCFIRLLPALRRDRAARSVAA